MDDPGPQPSPLSSPGSSVARRRALPPWSVDAGSPGVLVLHLLIQGAFHLSRPDGAVIELGAGDLLGIGCSANETGEGASGMRLHCSAPLGGAPDQEPGEVFSAVYHANDTGDAESWASRLPALIHLRAGEVRRDPGLPAIIRLLRAELLDGSREPSSVAHTLMTPLLAYAARCWHEASTGERRSGAPEPRDRRLARALALMRSRPAHPWTVESLAKAAGLSRAAFARRFQAELGVPPRRFLADRRMELASRLLAEGDESLAGVAAQIGYESEFAFSRAFKRHHGEAPGAFRRRIRAHAASGSTRFRAAA